jgi:ABC-type dipeptide/oligopeptide/nickel transport system permease subunit
MLEADRATLNAGALTWAEAERPRQRRWLRWWIHRPRLILFSTVIAAMVMVGVLADLIAPFDPIKTAPAQRLKGPSGDHLMGSDDLGRDVFSRVVFGARISLRVAIIAVSIALSIGLVLGMSAGYVGGFVDDLLSRFIDALLAFPGILLAIAITNALGPSLRNAMIAVGILGIPTYYRLTRAQVLQAREQEYVTAATVLGASQARILARHILPNIANPLIIAASIASSGAILALASLSFLGLGSQPPQPDWGSMIQQGKGYIGQADHLWVGPGIAMFVTVFSFYMLGDALRDALDPRLRNR